MIGGKVKSAYALLAMLGFGFASQGAAQHVIGGGDPVMLIFSEAQYEARRILENLDVNKLPAGAIDVKTWLGEAIVYQGQAIPRHKAMALEMARSTHSWQEGEIGLNKCAAIRIDPVEEPIILLSLPRCRDTLSISAAGGGYALQTLIHEVVHRFGKKPVDADELFASNVGVAVFSAWRTERQQGLPFWTSTDELLNQRYQPTAVWTGAGAAVESNQLLIWGGCNENPLPGSSVCSKYLNTGGRLIYPKDGPLGEPPQTRWLPINETDAPLGRKLHSAIWTGETKLATARNKMILFGGCRGDDTACDQSLAVTACPAGRCDDPRANHLIYDPKTDQWSALTPVNAPSPRVFHAAVWTSQDEMIVWGGLAGYQDGGHQRILGDGGILSFPEGKAEGEWRSLPPGDGAPAARYGQTGIWTGTEFLVWGGCGQEPGITRCLRPLNDGAFYNPHPQDGAPYWRSLLAPAFVTARTAHTAIWTGRYLIVWGGVNGSRVLSDGAIFDSKAASDPQTHGWRPINAALPTGETGRRDHVAVFEPLQGRMIIWGGVAADGTYPSRTLVYNIEDNTWTHAATASDPVGREGHIAAWIQDSLFVWGGYNRDNGFLSQGGIFNP